MSQMAMEGERRRGDTSGDSMPRASGAGSRAVPMPVLPAGCANPLDRIARTKRAE